MADILVSPGISITETDRSAYAARPLVAGAALIGPTVKGQVNIPTKVTSYNDYVRRFGTLFEIEENNALVQQEFLTSLAAKSYFEQGGDTLLVVRVAPENYFKEAEGTAIITKEVAEIEGEIQTLQVELNKKTTLLEKAMVEDPVDDEKVATLEQEVSTIQGKIETLRKQEGTATSTPFVLRTLSSGAYLNSVSGSTYNASVDERSDGSLVSGSADNLRFEISNVDEETGTFSLTIRRGDDTSKDKIVLESFTNLSLDPNSIDYIAKKIGDQHATIEYDDDEKPYVNVVGDYTNKSAFVYVTEVHNTLNYLCTDGVTVNKDAAGVSFDKYLPASQVGGFYGAEGVVGKNPNMGDSDTADYFENITKSSKFPQAVEPSDYEVAISLLENMDEYQINIVSAPGLLNTNVLGQLISLAETRGDCIAVVDLSDCDDSTKQAAEDAQSQNSSYAATYYPWLQMYSNTGRLVWCPASVVIPGVYVYNDKQAAPWYAPAGLTRGGIQGVVQTRKKLTKAHRDTLYKKNVNPIASFPGSGIVIYGQKTLQKKASALDRVNARRLMIELKKTVKEYASSILFEHNTASVRNSFRAKVEPYLETVVQRNGLYAYKVVIDELNDNDTIDRNEFRCQIYVQPTKVIEFIYIDFTITATGVEFNS